MTAKVTTAGNYRTSTHSFIMLARTPHSIRSQVTRLHIASPARYAHGHGEYHHLPFAFPGKKRAAFGMKLSLFLISGFSIPFAAAAFQLKKSGA